MPRLKPLDKNIVVNIAADLLNREGPEALTLHHLAGILGIQPPSLYNHIDGIAGLMHELALLNVRQLAERLGNVAMGRSGTAGLMAVAEAYRGYIKENPGLYLSSLRASGSQSTPDPELQAGEDSVVRIVLAMLDSLGLSDVDAIHAARALRSAVHGFTTLEIAGGFGLKLDLDESFARLIGMLVAGLRSSGGKSDPFVSRV
jgi:AcrR family transcriptional regulator